jgi:hypothetical protein
MDWHSCPRAGMPGLRAAAASDLFHHILKAQLQLAILGNGSEVRSEESLCIFGAPARFCENGNVRSSLRGSEPVVICETPWHQ